MKKILKPIALLLLLCGLLVTTACSSDDPDTTFTFRNSFTSAVEVRISEFSSSGSRIENHTQTFSIGQSREFIANPRTTHVKVFIIRSGNLSFNRWIQQVFYLNNGSNIDIVLTGTTMCWSK